MSADIGQQRFFVPLATTPLAIDQQRLFVPLDRNEAAISVQRLFVPILVVADGTVRRRRIMTFGP